MRKALVLLFVALTFHLNAQLGGQRAYEFLNLPSNARTSALGGTNITSGWLDPMQVGSNPALLNEAMTNQLVINRLGYFADIAQTSLAFVQPFEKLGNVSFSMDYLSYGNFDSYDENGFLNGEFSINEYVFSVATSQSFGPFSVGSALKLAVSDLSAFQSSAALLDVGGTFKHPEKDLTLGFVVKNIGFLISDYTEDNNSRLPTDIQLGATFKPEFMPFRFSLTARNLVRSDVVFFDPSTNSFLGEQEEPGFGEELFRRLVFGAELMASENFQVRVGYNHLLRQELKQATTSGGSGFSFGFMFKVKRFEFAYSRALYHTAGGSNALQMNFNLDGILNKNRDD